MSIIELKSTILKSESDNKQEVIKNYIDKLFEALELIDSTKNPDKIINSQDAYEKLCIIRSGSTFYQHIDEFFALLKSHNFIEIITNTLVYISDRLDDKDDQINFNRIKIPLDKWKIYDTTTLNERSIYILSYTIQIINSILPNSIEFAVYLSQKTLLNSILNLIKNETLINYLTTNNPKDIDTLFYILNWVSRYTISRKKVWLSLNTVDVLLQFNKKYPKYKSLVYIIIANIATDNQIESCAEIKDALNELSLITCNCINQNQKRKIESIDEETLEKQEVEISYICDEYCGASLSIAGLLIALYRLSINDNLKLKFFKNDEMMKAVRKLLFEGTDNEKDHVLQLLSQLSFEDIIRNDVSNDEELLKYVEDLLEKKEFTYKKLRKTADCFLWIIDELNNDINDIKQIHPSQKHVMISYHEGRFNFYIFWTDKFLTDLVLYWNHTYRLNISYQKKFLN
jgi:hypothetical protein